MIRIINAVLRCPKHPKYKAVRPPSGMTLCRDCEGIWYVIQNLKRLSKEYTLKFGMLLLATLISTAGGWHVDFIARSNTVGVQVETLCYKPGYDYNNGESNHAVTFEVVDFVQVPSNAIAIDVRRHDEAPAKHDNCYVIAHVFANDNKGDDFYGDPKGNYITESSEYVRQQ